MAIHPDLLRQNQQQEPLHKPDSGSTQIMKRSSSISSSSSSLRKLDIRDEDHQAKQTLYVIYFVLKMLGTSWSLSHKRN
jgi:hypothetical protein